MSNTEYQFNDFLGFLRETNGDYMGFVIEVHEMLLQMGCKIKMSSTKAYPFQAAYIMPKSRKGILNFYLRRKGLKVRITIINPDKHSDLLNCLPEKMVSQIDKKNICRKTVKGCKCLENCMGFDFNIGEMHYQRCRFDCFQFDVDSESIPFFFKLLERELRERQQL